MFGVAGLGLFRSFRGLGFKSSRRFKYILREGGLGVKAWNCSRIFGLGFALKFGGLGVPVLLCITNITFIVASVSTFCSWCFQDHLMLPCLLAPSLLASVA